MLSQYKSALYLVEQIDIVLLSLYVGGKVPNSTHWNSVYSVHVFIAKSVSVFYAPFPIRYIEFLYLELLLTDRFIMLFRSLQLCMSLGLLFWVPLYWSVVRFLISSHALHCWRPLTIHVLAGLYAGSCISFGWAVVINIFLILSLFSASALHSPALSVGVCCRERDIYRTSIGTLI